MVDVNQLKNQIISFLNRNGPSLPIQISKELKSNSLFTSAFLGELLDEKKIKTSTLKVGGTPLYLIQGQEEKLENFTKYLHSKEQEAVILLKKYKILKDSNQEPAIRVALRNLKDFASTFKNNDDIYWRYLKTTDDEIREILEPSSKKIEKKQEKPIEKQEPKPESKQHEPKQEQKQQEQKQPEKEKKPKQENQKQEFQNPLAIIPEKPKEKIKPKSEYVKKVINFIEKNNLKIIKEKEFKGKVYNCILEMQTSLGPISFLTQSKDKKTIADSDLQKLLSQAQSIPLPALMIYPGGLSKKAVEYQQKYYSILKALKM